MFFGDKSVVGPEKSFSCSDFYLYLESLLKEATQQDRRRLKSNNYSWLSSRGLSDSSVEPYLRDLTPIINKLSSESYTAIAVKLDRLTDERNLTTAVLLAHIRKLLLEQDSMQNIDKSVKRGKEKKRVNKVQPELNGRQAIVCFVVETDIL